jgi:hypothetical protein
MSLKDEVFVRVALKDEIIFRSKKETSFSDVHP